MIFFQHCRQETDAHDVHRRHSSVQHQEWHPAPANLQWLPYMEMFGDLSLRYGKDSYILLVDKNENSDLLLTLSSLMDTAATGAACPRSCRTNTSSFKSQMIHVRSLEPLTMILYAADAVRQVTASLWPNSDFFRVSRRLCRPLPNSHTCTT